MTEIISILYMKMIDIFADLSKNGRIERAVRKTTKDGRISCVQSRTDLSSYSFYHLSMNLGSYSFKKSCFGDIAANNACGEGYICQLALQYRKWEGTEKLSPVSLK